MPRCCEDHLSAGLDVWDWLSWWELPTLLSSAKVTVLLAALTVLHRMYSLSPCYWQANQRLCQSHRSVNILEP